MTGAQSPVNTPILGQDSKIIEPRNDEEKERGFEIRKLEKEN